MWSKSYVLVLCPILFNLFNKICLNYMFWSSIHATTVHVTAGVAKDPMLRNSLIWEHNASVLWVYLTHFNDMCNWCSLLVNIFYCHKNCEKKWYIEVLCTIRVYYASNEKHMSDSLFHSNWLSAINTWVKKHPDFLVM